MESSDDYISFKLLEENFTIKSDVPKDYFLSLVKYLDKKLKDVKKKLPNLTNIKVLILTALDISDELFKERESTFDKDAIKLISDLSESLASAIEEE